MCVCVYIYYVNKRVELAQRGIALQKMYVLLLFIMYAQRKLGGAGGARGVGWGVRGCTPPGCQRLLIVCIRYCGLLLYILRCAQTDTQLQSTSVNAQEREAEVGVGSRRVGPSWFVSGVWGVWRVSGACWGPVGFHRADGGRVRG